MSTLLPISFPLVKPQECSSCPYNTIGQGFTPDHAPANPKIAILTDFSSESSMTLRAPLGGDSGRQFFYRFLNPLGLSRDNVLISSVVRCRPPEGQYPIGDLRKNAEKMCRQWDDKHLNNCGDYVELAEGGLDTFNPDYFMISIDPVFINRTWSITRVVTKDMEKAMRLSEGRRLLLLLGDKPMSLICPDLDGGVLKWRSHHGSLDWKAFQQRMKNGKT